MIIALGFAIGFLLAELTARLQQRHARKTLKSWMPQLIEGRINYIDVSKLTQAQAHVLLEEMRNQR
jgi:hypothetical protein